jgi:hypothetical protein
MGRASVCAIGFHWRNACMTVTEDVFDPNPHEFCEAPAVIAAPLQM